MQSSAHVHTHKHTLAFLKTSAFPFSPNNARTAALLPGSQAGEKGTAVWSHGAHRFPFTSSFLTSSPFSFLPPFLMSLTFFLPFLHLCLRPTPTQTHSCSIWWNWLKRRVPLACRRNAKNSRIFPGMEGYFCASWCQRRKKLGDGR